MLETLEPTDRNSQTGNPKSGARPSIAQDSSVQDWIVGESAKEAVPDEAEPEEAELEEAPPDECAGIILAAGEGSRYMGETHKLLAHFKGRPLINWAVDAALEADLKDVYVVMGATDLSSVLPDNVILVKNEGWHYGQSSSLNVGIACARKDGYKSVVVGLGDAPLVTASVWDKVAETPGLIVTATYDGQPSPPVKLNEQVWVALPITGDEGARMLMQKRPDLVTKIECGGDSRDVDTTEDLRNL